MAQLPRLKVTGQCHGILTLEFRVRSIYPEPFEQFSLNFTQIFHSVRQCVESMTQLHRLKVKVTLQGHGNYPSICVCSISPESFERFSLNFTQMFHFSDSMCRTNDLAMHTQGQGHTSRSYDLPLNFVSAPIISSTIC